MRGRKSISYVVKANPMANDESESSFGDSIAILLPLLMLLFMGISRQASLKGN